MTNSGSTGENGARVLMNKTSSNSQDFSPGGAARYSPRVAPQPPSPNTTGRPVARQPAKLKSGVAPLPSSPLIAQGIEHVHRAAVDTRRCPRGLD